MNWAKQHEATGGSLVIDWESLHARFRPENGTQYAVESGNAAKDSKTTTP